MVSFLSTQDEMVHNVAWQDFTINSTKADFTNGVNSQMIVPICVHCVNNWQINSRINFVHITE